MIRRVLGWVDDEGNPTEERLVFSYSELAKSAGISRRAVPEVLKEAIDSHFIRCKQKPLPDTLQQKSQSGAYELCWDEDGEYTNQLVDFRGFYFPEAWTETEFEHGKTIRRSKVSRKNIPNDFFDVVVQKEPLSVIRTVGALLFYSIQWGKGGERKAPVSKSITELSTLTKLSRNHTHEALKEALSKGYVNRISEGIVDFNAGIQSRPATYTIRWQEPVRTSEHSSKSEGEIEGPVQKGERDRCKKVNGDRCKKVNGEPVQKGERDRCKKVNGDRCKKVNGIILKLDTKTSNTKTTTGGTPQPPSTDNHQSNPFVVAVIQNLQAVGFNKRTAQALSENHDAEVISRQIEWLPLRKASANVLGLLRRAIEEDWPKPESAKSPEHSLIGQVFAQQFYGAYQGTPNELAANIFRNDAEESARFLSTLNVQADNVKTARDLGRKFGEFVRDGYGIRVKPAPFLTVALVQFGNVFRRKMQMEIRSSDKNASQKARDAHREVFFKDYMEYLAKSEKACQEAIRGLYDGFVKEWKKSCEQMTKGPISLKPETITRMQSETARLHAFFDYCQKTSGFEVLDFWQWDIKENSTPFHHQGVSI